VAAPAVRVSRAWSRESASVRCAYRPFNERVARRVANRPANGTGGAETVAPPVPQPAGILRQRLGGESPNHVVASWLGHSPMIAATPDLQTRKRPFRLSGWHRERGGKGGSRFGNKSGNKGESTKASMRSLRRSALRCVGTAKRRCVNWQHRIERGSFEGTPANERHHARGCMTCHQSARCIITESTAPSVAC
jgi:hypothetical protein